MPCRLSIPQTHVPHEHYLTDRMASECGTLSGTRESCLWAPTGKSLSEAASPPPNNPGFCPPHLEQVVSRGHIGDVYPLTVNVMTVHVPASHGDALFSEVGTLVALLNVCR